MIQKIILVFKTHFDIGFTDLAANVIHRYGDEMLRQVIETCRATEDMGPLRYVWTMPSWPLWHICSHCDPTLKADLEHYIENGQIVWHSLPFTSHTDFSAPEEYAQALIYTKLLAQRYGRPIPIAAKMTDVPGHGQMLPHILASAGIRFLHLGCNEFATPPQVPRLFFWESRSGERVLTMYSKGGYGTGLLPPKDWKYPVWMALMHTHDNCGPQSAGLIREMVEKAKKAYPEAEIVCGTMDDFCREMEICDLSDVPVVREDLADTWIHGAGSYPAEVGLLRESRERARRLHGRYLQKLLSGEKDPRIEELWAQYYGHIALFTEHTWGADVKTWLGPDRVYEKDAFRKAKSTPSYQFMERSWEEQRQRAREAAQTLDRLAEILGDVPENESGADPLVIACNGSILTAEASRYRLEMERNTGKILRILDKTLKAVILEAGEEDVFAYRYDRYGLPEITEFLRAYGYHFTTWGIQDYGRENYPDCEREVYYPRFLGWDSDAASLTLRYGAEESAASYGDCTAITLKLTFCDAIRAELKLTGKQETPFVESGSLVLPMPGKAHYRIGKPGGVVDPEADIAPCCNHALFNLEREVTVLGEQACMRIISHDAPLFGIGTPGVYEYHREFGENRANTLYFNLFNNMWGTNFPQWIGGDFRFRFTLQGCTRAEADAAPAWAAEVCAGGESPVPGMELLHTQEADGCIYVMLRDLTGTPGTRHIRIPGMAVTAVDLMHRETETLPADGSFAVRPYGVHVFALRGEQK